MNKVLRVKCELPLIYYEDAKKLLNNISTDLRNFNKKITVRYKEINYDVKIAFFKKFNSNEVEFLLRVFFNGVAIAHKHKLFNKKEQLLGIYKLLVSDSTNNEEFYLTVNLELDMNKDSSYYKGKRNILYNLTLNDDNYLDALCLNHSLTNKIERIELIYSVLVRKIKTGRYGMRNFKPQLMNNLNYMGYDRDYISSVDVINYKDMKNDDEIFNNMLLYLLCNLYGSKKVKLPKDTKYIDSLYDLYFEMLEVEGIIK